MKRDLILSLVIIFLFSTQAIALAADGPETGVYVSGNLGASIANDADYTVPGVVDRELELGTGVLINLGAGYDFGSFRADLELGYRAWSIGDLTQPGAPAFYVDGDMGVFTVMVNGYYDHHIAQSKWVPFVGVGLGMADIKFDDGIDDSTDTVFAYQVKVGTGYMLSKTVTLSAEYRYFGAADPTFGEPVSGEFETSIGSHDLNVGVRFLF